MSASNLYPSRDDLNGDTTINFPIPVRYLQITNTNGSAVLKWRFKESKDFSELEPTEIITMEDINIHNLYLQATNGSYRVLGQG
ncbi:MAG: hypothetical protein OEY29_14500 [Gammaproteobacteria bacterium]|nr:hypothetical protein [Gammaproteobacteria bacterium]